MKKIRSKTTARVVNDRGKAVVIDVDGTEVTNDLAKSLLRQPDRFEQAADSGKED